MRTLIAGLGNIFEGDDGFGVEVVRRLAATDWPDGVELRDFGIRGVHLAYELLDPYDLVVIVDAVQRGDAPGTVYVIEHGPDDALAEPADDAPLMDAHDLAPDGVLALVPRLGGTLGPVIVVGCEPASITPSMELTAPVAASVDKAAQLVIGLVFDAHAVPVGGG
jgi:hydrogenase maturation protease